MPVLELEVVDRCLVMTLNRPERRNAIDTELADDLRAAVRRLDEDPALRVGVLAANGPTFCAGMDLRDFAVSGPPRSLFSLARAGSRKPLVAAVEGPAHAGGLELVLTCDVVVAGPRAEFALPEVKRGLIAGAGGLYRLGRRVGEGLAAQMVLTGEPVDARRAAAAGLVSVLVDDDVRGAGLRIAQQVAAASPVAVRASKRLLREAQGTTFEEYWQLQRPWMAAVGASTDSREGALAFVEKRAPVWGSDVADDAEPALPARGGSR